MRNIAYALAALCGLLWAAGRAEARVQIRVDLPSQTMYVTSAEGDYAWPISSARVGYRTPRGSFGVQRMEVMHRSHKYHNSPMPHSLFFSGGYAIHGTYDVASLGQPASHGCIRIATENAAALFQMVQAEGGAISIQGNAPASGHRNARRATHRTYARASRRSRDPDYADGHSGHEPSNALGYAPQPARTLGQWADDPFGF